jgi:CDGSH-type Zn-finger protein
METAFKSTTGSRDRTRTFCACGLSLTFPFCDGSQKIAKTHSAEKLMSCGPAKELDPSNAGARELTA